MVSDKPAHREYLFSFDGAIRDLLRGCGQVFFQQSAWTGLFFLVGIFWGSYYNGCGAVAWGCLVGVISSTFAGWLIGENVQDGQDGLWGFNGALTGCAFPTFMQNTPLMWLSLILCAMLTTYMRRGFNNVWVRFGINSLTFPFVFCCWIFFLSARVFTNTPLADSSAPALMVNIGGHLDWTFPAMIIYWLRGIGQAFLINNALTGIFFLAGLFVCSRWACLYAAGASALALITALVFGADPSDVSNGLFGFSAVLTGIAVGTTFYKVSWRSAIWTAAAVVATVFVQAGMDALLTPWGIPTLTGPFCVATWLFLLPLYNLNREAEKPDMTNWHTKKNN